MAFTDIRTMELSDGTTLPVGHGEFAVGRVYKYTSGTNTVFQFRINCLNVNTGVLKVLVTSKTGPWATISIPWYNCKPTGHFICDAPATTLVPSTITSLYKIVGGEAGSYVEITFPGSVAYEAVAFLSLPDCSVLATNASMSSATTLTRMNTLPLLTEGVDYGTSSQKDSITAAAGRLFFVKVE